MPVVHDIFARQPRKRARTEAHAVSLHAESEQQQRQHDCHMHDQYDHTRSHEEEEEKEEKQEERKHDSDERMEEEEEKESPSNGRPTRPTQVLYINEKDLIETDDQARKRRRFEQNKLWCEAATRCAEAANKTERLRAELIAKITRQNQKLNQNSVRNAPLAADVAVAAEKARQIEVLLKDDAVGVRARQERLQQAESGLLDEFAQLTIQAEKEHRIGEEAERVYSRRFIAGDRLRDAGFSKGWMRFRAVMSRLDSLGFTRSNLQKTLHLHFLQACLALIFGAEWAEVKDEVFAMLGIERINTEVLARTARRMGKTASVAMFVVAMLESCTGIKICIFSTGQRASSALMTEIKRLLKKLPNGLERIVKETQEELRFAPAAVGKTKNEKRAAELSDDVSVLYSYPAATTSQFTHTHLNTRNQASWTTPTPFRAIRTSFDLGHIRVTIEYKQTAHYCSGCDWRAHAYVVVLLACIYVRVCLRQQTISLLLRTPTCLVLHRTTTAPRTFFSSFAPKAWQMWIGTTRHLRSMCARFLRRVSTRSIRKPCCCMVRPLRRQCLCFTNAFSHPTTQMRARYPPPSSHAIATSNPRGSSASSSTTKHASIPTSTPRRLRAARATMDFWRCACPCWRSTRRTRSRLTHDT